MKECPPSSRPPGGWLDGRVWSFRWAFRGLGHCLRTQPNARIHAAATAVALALGFWLGLARWEWCAVLAVTGLVWAAELFNTAIEGLVDLVSPERQPLAGRIKDVAAGAVLAAAIAAALVGAIIFLPKLWALAAGRAGG